MAVNKAPNIDCFREEQYSSFPFVLHFKVSFVKKSSGGGNWSNLRWVISATSGELLLGGSCLAMWFLPQLVVSSAEACSLQEVTFQDCVYHGLWSLMAVITATELQYSRLLLDRILHAPIYIDPGNHGSSTASLGAARSIPSAVLSQTP